MEGTRLLSQHDTRQGIVASRRPSLTSELDDTSDRTMASQATNPRQDANENHGAEWLQPRFTTTNRDGERDGPTDAPATPYDVSPAMSGESDALRLWSRISYLEGGHDALRTRSAAAHEPAPPLSSIMHVSDVHRGDSSIDQPSQTAYEGERDNPHTNIAHEYWMPFWLHNRTLSALAALFAGLAAGLIIVWAANKAQDGFPTVLTTNHYAWTYGPTAVLVVVLSLWRQVDYHCKMIQPWRELRKGSVDAERSMLLDYLSPLNVISFVQAMRFRHHPVVASITGFGILKIVVLISTGLLVLTPVTITASRNVMITSEFDSESFWETIPGESHSYGYPDDSVYENVSAHPIRSYLNTFGEDAVQPVDIADSIVLQSLAALGSNLETISTDVTTFVPNVSCEAAHVTLSESYGKMRARVDIATCSYEGHDLYTTCDYSCVQAISYNFWRVNCSAEPTDGYQASTLDVNSVSDVRFAMLVSNLTFEQTITPENFTGLTEVPHQTAAVICKVDYSMRKSIVTQNLTNGASHVVGAIPLPKLSNLSGLMLTEVIYSMLRSLENLMGDLERDPLRKITVPVPPTEPFYNTLLQTLDGQQSIERFLSETTLQSHAKRMLEGIAAHFIRENYLRPVSTELPGTVVFNENRLRIGAASLWTMVAGLVLLVLLTVCIMLTSPRNVVPRDPRIISTDAIVLASSSSLHQLLQYCNHAYTSEIVNLLRGIKFGTPASASDFFQIVVTGNYIFKNSEKPHTRKKVWAPLPAKYPMVFLTLAPPLAGIVALEILYRISEANKGLLEVSGWEETATYLSRYTSALVVLLIATFFNGLDFTVASFAPYSSLKAGAVPAQRGIDFQILGSLPLFALLRSARGRHASLCFSNIGGMIGSVLTIIASGLWVVDRAVVVNHSVTASLASAWDIEWTNSTVTGDGGAGVVLEQIQHGSWITPPTIQGGVVLPEIADIRLSATNMPAHDSGDLMVRNNTFQIVGMRPLLTCEVIADKHIVISQDGSVNALPPLPYGCQLGGPAGNDSYYNFSATAGDGFYGNFYDLHLGPFNSSGDRYQYEYGERGQALRFPDNPAGCPSIGVIFANSFNESTRKEFVSVLMCSQKLQEVQLNVTYSDQTKSAARTPAIVEISTENLTNGTDGIDTFPFRVETYLHQNLSFLGSYMDPNDAERFDVYLDHMVYGPNGTAPGDMLGKSNEQVLIGSVQDLYVKYMCLVIDMKFRQPIAEEARADDAGGRLLGTAYSFSSRLQLNSASKLTMQIMLGIMFVLGSLTFLLTDLRGTLPRKPTSIASRMALLAGSDLCDENKGVMPRDAMWMSRKELDSVFDGWLFSLGWWKRSEGTENDQGEGDSSDDGNSSGRQQRRFGIDVGVPEQLGFRETKWWALRRRLARRSS